MTRTLRLPFVCALAGRAEPAPERGHHPLVNGVARRHPEVGQAPAPEKTRRPPWHRRERGGRCRTSVPPFSARTRARPPARRRATDAALTLFEMLIVMAIIGIASAAAVIGTSVLTRDNRTADEAARLATLLQVAGDEALVNGRPLVLEWSDGGYGFRRWLGEGAGWGAASDPRLSGFRALPSGLTLRHRDERSEVLPIAPGGLGAAATLLIEGKAGAWTVAFDGLRARAMPGVATP